MAVAFVQGKWSGSTASTSVTLAAGATAGNYLCVFIAKSANETAPKVSSDVGGETGWAVNATKVAGSFNLWFAIKKAEGGEKVITASEGTIHGVACAEVSGTNGEIDKITSLGTSAKNKAGVTAAFTSTDAAAFFMVGTGTTASGPFGVIEAWTGGPPTLTNPETATTRCSFGYSVPGALIEAKTFTFNHVTEREVNFLGVTLKPTPEATGNPVSMLL